MLQDYRTAVKWCRRAAEQGIPRAQRRLGWMYYKGEGVSQDNVYAHMWSLIAASSGECEEASENRKIIAAEMTPSQIQKALDFARECVRKNYKGF